METKLWFALAIAAGTLHAQDARAVLQNASLAMGSPRTIQYSGTGMNAFFGQALLAGREWPRRQLTSYSRAINYEQKSSSEEFGFTQEVFGGQRQNAWVNGERAWNVAASGAAAPQVAAAEERQLQIWLTPHGFLKAALDAGNATVKSRKEDGKNLNVVTFTALGKYKVDGAIDAQGMVTRVETKVTNPVLGDMAVITTYGGYKDFSGVLVASTTTQKAAGQEFSLTIDSVKVNEEIPADKFALPAEVKALIAKGAAK